MHGRMATYRVKGNAQELTQRAEEGMLPIFEEQPGFRSYALALDGDELLSFSVWDSREAAEAGNAAAADWVRENMASEIELMGTRYAEILLSTALGVHA